MFINSDSSHHACPQRMVRVFATPICVVATLMDKEAWGHTGQYLTAWATCISLYGSLSTWFVWGWITGKPEQFRVPNHHIEREWGRLGVWVHLALSSLSLVSPAVCTKSSTTASWGTGYCVDETYIEMVFWYLNHNGELMEWKLTDSFYIQRKIFSISAPFIWRSGQGLFIFLWTIFIESDGATRSKFLSTLFDR
jgi:hypothetical protein